MGRDLVGVIDPARWATDDLQHPKRSEPGRSITFSAGVLSRIDAFDAAFFGISPREAELMDPQQRLLLELAWEAMESGAIKPSALAGTDCSVYVGISGLDYGMRMLDDLSGMSAHSMTGNTMSIAANRLSYAFDLRGPSLAVDTACSSSLVALHHACESLRTGQSSTALVGGVNLLLHPYPFVGFTKASMLSATGRCRAFGEGGDGYVRAEGAAVLLLKPLEAAQAEGDRIFAVIRSTGVNADGARKSGITIPSAAGQTELMRDVLARAELDPQDVDYIEAHGTGTKVGDPIEAAAISAVYGLPGQRRAPLPIGSVKSNLGHMEPASGMAGLVKAILTLQHRTLAPSIHAEVLNPLIDFDALNLQLVRAPQPWQPLDRPMRVGVNSFGFGGVNGHVILEEAPPRKQVAAIAALRDRSATASGLVPLVISARDEGALRELAAAYAERLQSTAARMSIAQAAWHNRDWQPERLCVADVTSEAAMTALHAFARREDSAQILRERALPAAGKVAWVYSGNGAQWVGMGLQLMQQSPRFLQALQEVDLAIQKHGGPCVVDALSTQDSHAFSDTSIAQPALFAVQVALTELLRQQGLQADAATGHSVGEIAAAWAVGILSLNEAARVIVARSQAQALTRGTGRMAAVGLGANAMTERLRAAHLADVVEIAAHNSPRNITVSATQPALDALAQALQGSGVFFRELDLDYAFHSHLMDPIQDKLVDSLQGLELCAGAGTFFSTVTGDQLDGAALDATYWWRNVREPVQFGPAIARMAAAGYNVFIEVSPHAILQRYITETLDDAKVGARVFGTGRRDQEDLSAVQATVLRAALVGAPVDAGAYFAAPGRCAHVELPPYAWQRQRFWNPGTAESYGLISRHAVHPLLGYRLKEPAAAWEVHLDPLKQPWLNDHRVGNAVVLPGAGYVDMALAASREWFGGERYVIEGLDILAPVVLDGEHARTLRLFFNPQDLRFRIEGRQRLSDDAWVVHVQGRLLGAPAQDAPPPAAIAEPQGSVQRVYGEALYATATRLGMDYGPSFRGIQSIDVGQDTLTATLAWAKGAEPATHHVLAPAVLDQCFQSVFGWLHAQGTNASQGMTFLPVGFGRITQWAAAVTTQAQRLRARRVRRSPRSVLVDFELLDDEGSVLVTVQGARFRAAAIAAAEKMPALWTSVLRLVPLETAPAEATLPSCSVLRQELVQHASAQALAADQRYFSDVAPLIEALPLAYARDALLAIAGQAKGDAATLQSLREAHPLWSWCLNSLQADGLLHVLSEGWTLDEQDLPPTPTIWSAAASECPQAIAELLPLARVGKRLAQLAGRESVVPESVASSETMDRDSPALRFAAQTARDLLQALAAQWPEGRRMRILDIGQGESMVIRALRGNHDEARTDYVLARSIADDLAHLRSQYAHDPHVQIVSIDSNTGALEDGVAFPSAFDLVVFDQTLHTWAAPAMVLEQLARQMRDDAIALVLERRPDRASNLVFGLDPQWWHTRDGEAVGSLMSPASWQTLLQESGWEDVVALTDPQADAIGLGSFVLLAKPPQAAQVQGSPAEPAKAWRVLSLAAQPSAWASEVGSALQQQGQDVQAVQVGQGDESTALPGQVDVCFLDALPEAANAETVADACTWLRQRMLERAAVDSAATFCVVTHGGILCAAGEGVAANPAAVALSGLVRVAANELAPLKLRLIDVQLDPAHPRALARLVSELQAVDSTEDEVLLQARGRYGVRVEPADLCAPRAELRPARPPMESSNLGADQRLLETRTVGAQVGWRLDFTLPGQLRNLHWREEPLRALGDHDIEIAACAAALNFRDVMYAMGLLSDEALEQGFAGPALGLEVAGLVSRCGPKVTRFKPGDAVLAFAGASFASHVVVPERAAASKPDSWSFEEAATVPTVFFTVWYALQHLAQLQPGERVLIHGAAGGVGMAALQVARLLGAEIYATAGTAEKRELAQLLGADHVFDSRSNGFDEAILVQTQGQGVDVVLNSLAGQAIERNLRVLRPFGRFIELGKRDFYENTAIGLRPFRNNISYFGVDADQLMQVRPDLASRIFAEVMQQFASGKLSPLPCRVFAPDEVVEAFRDMQQARHIGKLVINLQQPPSHIARHEPAAPFTARRDATYLITGGLGGFGLETAAWLAELGAGRLVLAGRRGADTPGAEAAMQRLRALGAEVELHACDVADRQQVQALMRTIARADAPLRGVVHAAMVLDDGLLPQLDAERFCKVLAPKLNGAWNLHHCTQDQPLDFFIVDSSATTLLGNPGQANYVAANAALEAFGQWRRQQGLPATVVAWGPIGDVGVLTTNAHARESLESRLGAAPLQSARALHALGQLLAHDASGLVVMDFDWGTLQHSMPSAQSARFETLRFMHARNASGQAGGSQADADLRAHLAALPHDEALQVLAQWLSAEVAEILRLPAGGVPHDRPLHDLGMDSLMAVELGLSLEKRLAVSIPPMFLHDSPTILRIAERLLASVHHAGEEGDATRDLVQSLAAQHAEGDITGQVDSLASAVREKTQTGARLIA